MSVNTRELVFELLAEELGYLIRADGVLDSKFIPTSIQEKVSTLLCSENYLFRWSGLNSATESIHIYYHAVEFDALPFGLEQE